MNLRAPRAVGRGTSHGGQGQGQFAGGWGWGRVEEVGDQAGCQTDPADDSFAVDEVLVGIRSMP
jgi:hypothetical protein